MLLGRCSSGDRVGGDRAMKREQWKVSNVLRSRTSVKVKGVLGLSIIYCGRIVARL